MLEPSTTRIVEDLTGPSRDRDVYHDEEFYSEEEVEQQEPTSSVAQVEDEVRELKQQNEKLRLQNQRTGDSVERLEDAMMRLLEILESKSLKSSKSSRSTSVQPKASQSAPPEVKAGGSKEVPIALESDVEEINPLRAGETKPGRWSTEKPDPDPPKREKSKPPKRKGVARDDPDDSDSSSSDSSGGPPKKKDRRSSPSSSSSSSSSESSSELGVGLKDRKKDSKKSSDGDMLRQTDYSFQQLIDDFNSEFHNRTNRKKKNNNGRLHNARKGKGGNNNSRDSKPVWNKDGEPLCFNCGKYGHMAKDCPEPQKQKNGKGKKGKRGQNGGQRQGNGNSGNSSQNNRSNSSRGARGGNQNEEQFIPEGLKDLYRINGKTFNAYVNE
ncbi:hypothetical protein DL765_002963 [Monosporascus sp. GIB2]|nr:hypothetical protein DL765_002963 [Monosporascus sp. GIB2]